MRIIIPSIQVPFIFGGAQLMTDGLRKALINHGHEVEVIRFPFKFSPESYLSELMDFCQHNNFEEFNGYYVDQVIALQFPAYYVQHPNKTLWLMHQHRTVYELYDMQNKTSELQSLRKKIIECDTKELSSFNGHFSMCQNVSNRLLKYNGISSQPVYHPPANADSFTQKVSEDYIFCPSRLEALKRQDLLIKALKYTKTNVKVIIAGDGGQLNVYQQLAESLGVSHKLRFLGHISEQEKVLFYAHSLGVFFGPYDEDYGYITLEAMLSSKPVITCSDSGGPLEFVVNNETGFITDPEPEQIAEKMDFLFNNKLKAKALGEHGREHYDTKGICWDNVVKKLVGN